MLILAVAVISTAFVGCKKDKEDTTTDETGDNNALIILEDRNIEIEEALFFAFDMQGQYESQFGADVMSQEYGEGTVGDMVKSQALESAVAINLAAYEAEKTGVTLTDEEKKTQADHAKTYFEGMDPAAVTQNGFTLELMQDIFMKYALRNKYMESQLESIPIDEVALQEALDQTALVDLYYASILKYGLEESAVGVRAKHILIKTVDDAGAKLPQDQLDAALVKANEALAKAKAGEDFAALVTQYSQDPGSLDTEGEYTFARGEFVPEFEAAAFSMEPGEISDIVETDYGYHIIKLEEKGVAATEEQIQNRKDYETKTIEDAKALQNQAYFEAQYKVWQGKYKVTINNQMWQAIVIKGQTGSTPAPSTTETETETKSE